MSPLRVTLGRLSNLQAKQMFRSQPSSNISSPSFRFKVKQGWRSPPFG